MLFAYISVLQLGNPWQQKPRNETNLEDALPHIYEDAFFSLGDSHSRDIEAGEKPKTKLHTHISVWLLGPLYMTHAFSDAFRNAEITRNRIA